MEAAQAEFSAAMRLDKPRALPDTPDPMPQDLISTTKAHIHSMVDYLLPLIKQQFGFQIPRVLGLATKRCYIHVLTALTNLYLARGHLPAEA